MIKRIILACLLVNLAFCSLRQLALSDQDKAQYNKCVEDHKNSPTAVLAVVAKLKTVAQVQNGCANITQISTRSKEYVTIENGCSLVKSSVNVRKALFGLENEVDGEDFECKILIKEQIEGELTDADYRIKDSCYRQYVITEKQIVNVIARVKGDVKLKSYCLEVNQTQLLASELKNLKNDQICSTIKENKNVRKGLMGSDADLTDYSCQIVYGKDKEFVEDCKNSKSMQGQRCGVAARSAKDDAAPLRVCSDFKSLQTTIKTKAEKDTTVDNYCTTLKDNFQKVTNLATPPIYECECGNFGILIQSLATIFLALYLLF